MRLVQSAITGLYGLFPSKASFDAICIAFSFSAYFAFFSCYCCCCRCCCWIAFRFGSFFPSFSFLIGKYTSVLWYDDLSVHKIDSTNFLLCSISFQETYKHTLTHSNVEQQSVRNPVIQRCGLADVCVHLWP